METNKLIASIDISKLISNIIIIDNKLLASIKNNTIKATIIIC